MLTGVRACTPSTTCNQRLLGAALAGLLCLAPSGCSSNEDAYPGTGDAGARNSAAAGTGVSVGGDNRAAGAAGGGGAPVESAHITSSKAVGVLTEEDFQALCDARGGIVEVMPHCGGFATASGFSYDNRTELLSEHTCAGANTCGGWNCVIVD